MRNHIARPAALAGIAALLLAGLAAAGAAANDTRRYVEQMAGVVAIPPGEPIAAGAESTFRADAPRARGKRTLLFLEIRMHSEQHGGCNYGMAISVNGKDLSSARDWMNRRLIGKTPVAHVKNYVDAKGPWCRAGQWLLMYAPDFADRQIEEGDDCLFLWDVTDLIRPAGGDEVRIEHTGKRLEEQVKRPIPLRIGRFQFGTLPEEVFAAHLGKPPVVPGPAAGTRALKGDATGDAAGARAGGGGKAAGAPAPGGSTRSAGARAGGGGKAAGGPAPSEGAGAGTAGASAPAGGSTFSCWVTAGGGLAVRVGGETFPIRSRFTYPGRPQGGWNALEPAAASAGEPAWQPAVRREGDALAVEATGAAYSLSRRVRVDRHRVVVRDTFRNRTDRVAGLRFLHEVDCTGRVLADAAVCGDQDPNHTTGDRPADNPTFFLKVGRAGLGILAEDDVFRVQSQIEVAYPLARLGSDHFGLAAGASYTVEWALYPTPTADAWDFLNQVRRDWNVNFTLPAGSFWSDCSVLARMSDAELKQYIEWTGGKWIMATPWLDCDPLPGRPTYAQVAAIARPIAEKIRRVCPDARLLLGTHPTMNFAPPGKGYDGDAYRDSFILDAEGKHFWHPYYTSYFCVGAAKEQGFLNYCNFMVPGNAYFRKMMDETNVALEQAGVGGIYCDEFNHYNCCSPRTYGRWDGHTVDLDDATFEAKTDKPYALLSLVTDEAQQQYAESIMKRGAFLANAQPVTRRTQRMHFPRFVETPSTSPAFHAALYSPLAYGNPPLPKEDAGLFQFVRDRVECAVLTHLGGMPNVKRPCVTARMFPFTPVDVRPGVLTGRERVVASRSGTFGWAGSYRARLFLYDREGVLAEAEPPAKEYRGKVKVDVPEKGMAVLERET